MSRKLPVAIGVAGLLALLLVYIAQERDAAANDPDSLLTHPRDDMRGARDHAEPPSSVSPSSFDRVDANHDGAIDRGEWETAVARGSEPACAVCLYGLYVPPAAAPSSNTRQPEPPTWMPGTEPDATASQLISKLTGERARAVPTQDDIAQHNDIVIMKDFDGETTDDVRFAPSSLLAVARPCSFVSRVAQCVSDTFGFVLGIICRLCSRRLSNIACPTRSSTAHPCDCRSACQHL